MRTSDFKSSTLTFKVKGARLNGGKALEWIKKQSPGSSWS